jgi:hypothetical protein
VGFAVLSRVWQLFTGPVTQLLIVLCLSRAAQDYYYAILGLIGLQIFLELGLHVVLINVASHEWSQLQLEDGFIKGDPIALSRLVSLGRTATAWYVGVAVAFAIVVAVAGARFFQSTEQVASPEASRAAVDWLLPWIAVVVVHALLLMTIPLTAHPGGLSSTGDNQSNSSAVGCRGNIAGVGWFSFWAVVSGYWRPPQRCGWPGRSG